MFRTIIIRFQAWMAMRCMVSQARALFKKDGNRRFVIPFSDGTMECLTVSEAMALKKEGHLAADLTPKLMYNVCYFFTDSSAEHAAVKAEMPHREFVRRQRFYYHWFERHHSK